MTNITNFQDILGATNGDKTSVLGKFLYFSLANILVEKEALAQFCEDLNIPYSGSKRISVSDAFRSATGDIKDRITVKNPGEHHIYAVYCRDNAHTEDVYSRELVKETLNQRTNQYEKLANIFYDRRDSSGDQCRCQSRCCHTQTDYRAGRKRCLPAFHTGSSAG